VNFEKNHPQPLRVPITLKIIDDNWYELTGVKGLQGLNENKQYFFGQRVEGRGYSFTINRVAPYNEEIHGSRRYTFIINDPLNLARSYRSSLTIEPLQPESAVFKVSFKATTGKGQLILQIPLQKLLLNIIWEKKTMLHKTLFNS
jgi:hypothetical protein